MLSGLGAGLAVEEDARELYLNGPRSGFLSHLPSGDRLHSRAVAMLLGHADNRVGRFVELVIGCSRGVKPGAETARRGD